MSVPRDIQSHKHICLLAWRIDRVTISIEPPMLGSRKAQTDQNEMVSGAWPSGSGKELIYFLN